MEMVLLGKRRAGEIADAAMVQDRVRGNGPVPEASFININGSRSLAGCQLLS